MAPKRKKGSETETETVEVYVGTRTEPYKFSKALLCSAAPYFDRALNGNFREASEKRLHFPDVRLDVFDMFVRWLNYKDSTVPFDIPEEGLTAYYRSIDLFCFADLVGIPELQNAAIRKIHSLGNEVDEWFKPERVLSRVFRITPESHPLRSLITTVIAFHYLRFNLSLAELLHSFNTVAHFCDLFWAKVKELGVPATYPSDCTRYYVPSREIATTSA